MPVCTSQSPLHCSRFVLGQLMLTTYVCGALAVCSPKDELRCKFFCGLWHSQRVPFLSHHSCVDNIYCFCRPSSAQQQNGVPSDSKVAAAVLPNGELPMPPKLPLPPPKPQLAPKAEASGAAGEITPVVTPGPPSVFS